MQQHTKGKQVVNQKILPWSGLAKLYVSPRSCLFSCIWITCLTLCPSLIFTSLAFLPGFSSLSVCHPLPAPFCFQVLTRSCLICQAYWVHSWCCKVALPWIFQPSPTCHPSDREQQPSGKRLHSDPLPTSSLIISHQHGLGQEVKPTNIVGQVGPAALKRQENKRSKHRGHRQGMQTIMDWRIHPSHKQNHICLTHQAIYTS